MKRRLYLVPLVAGLCACGDQTTVVTTGASRADAGWREAPASA